MAFCVSSAGTPLHTGAAKAPLCNLFGALSKNYQFDFSENKLKWLFDRFQKA
jgi:hypothetical protein